MDRPETPATVEELRAALANAEARYDALVRRAGYGIYRSTAQGRFLEANATLVAMLGYASVEELLTLDLSRDVYLDPDERGRLMQRSPAIHGYPEWFETRW